MYTKEQILDYMKNHYPNEDTITICQKLELTLSAIRTIATRNGIHKSKEYLRMQHERLLKIKEEKYLASIQDITLTKLEQNILVGSILGDGSLAFSPRSRNAYYREHFSIKQKEYRIWKMNTIHSLKFRIENECHLKSPSHPIFTELHQQYFVNGIKMITKENIKLLNHPIGLACLYMDDGTLVIDTSSSTKKIYLFPRITIYSLSFSKEENEILIEHIKNDFGINFKLKLRPDGSKYCIELSKRNEIMRFIQLVEPFINNIPSMKYKIDIQNRLDIKKNELIHANENKEIIISPLEIKDVDYSAEEENFIIKMKLSGHKDKDISNLLVRSYWGVVDKIRRLRKEGKM